MQQQNQFKGQSKGSRRQTLVTIMIGFILPVLVGAGVYFWQQSVLKSQQDEAKEIQAALSAQIEVLQEQVNKLQGADDSGATDDDTSLDAATVKTIAEASKWQDLKPYAADSVEVILGASEGLGTRTADQMVSDLKYLDSASGPWNFSLDASVVNGYKAGDYRQYFTSENQIIGRSSDGYVVAFTLGDGGKITNVFMISSDELL